MKRICTLTLLILCSIAMYSQNTVVTDNDLYESHPSAMLDVYSLSKGLLVPRLTTVQRTAIASPADGLLVFDTDADQYYYFANSNWHSIDAPSLWTENTDTIFSTGDGKRYGIGTASPLARLTVQGDASLGVDEPLFEVKNSAGDVIFAVYENEVKVNFKETVKGVKGGFAIGGLTGTKAEPVEYMRVTPDSVRIYINDTGTKGVKGGFAIGGLTGTKGSGEKYFLINDDSARIYLNQPAKGVKGGFAIGGLTGTKGTKEQYLTIERDSSRMYINEAAKGVKGGFAIGGLTGTKANEGSFLNLTKENYFIGHRAGLNTTPFGASNGQFNSFFGYEAGIANTSGSNNVFIGFNAGHSNTQGANHVFIGKNAGYNYLGTDDGEENVYIGNDVAFNDSISTNSIYIGTRAGYNMKEGSRNIIIGDRAGSGGSAQSDNVFLGGSSGRDNNGLENTMLGSYAGYTTNGDNNVFVGYEAGGRISGSNNVFIGHRAGYNLTNENNVLYISIERSLPLIYGEFDNQLVGINTTSPQGTFHVVGEATMGSVVIAPSESTSGASSEIKLAGDDDGTYNMSMRYNGDQNRMEWHAHNNGDDFGPLAAISYNTFNGVSNFVTMHHLPSTNDTYDLGSAGFKWDDIYATNGTIITSDKRLKDEITPLNYGLDEVLKMNPVSYFWKTNRAKGMKIGMIAQELIEVVPEVVNVGDDENKTLGIRYSELTPILIKAMQEQQTEIEDLKKRIENLEKLLNK